MATDNELQLIHSEITGIPAKFRERVSKECNWSLPTYYRKMRDNSSHRPPFPERISGRILSNAERDKIANIRIEIYTELFSRYVNKDKRGRYYISR